MPHLKELLKLMAERKASDLHLAAGSPPQLRVDGRLEPLPQPPLTEDEAQSLCYEVLTPDQVQAFERDDELDLALAQGSSRYRVNLYRQKGSVAGAFRAIPIEIPRPDQLGIPEAALPLATRPRGLVLVTGPTGSGKSTTLASLIDQINRSRPEHIVTIEDPIEFIHQHKKSLVSQREVGRDSKNFGEGLRHILRQDPNVILIGEMRDLETVSAAITVSETGHLVFATLHTNTAAETINRIVDIFPAHQQSQVRTQLSFTLEGILCQQLIPRIGGGRALATELLLANTAIRNLIRENKIHQIPSQLQMGQKESGMHTMDQSLAELVQKEIVSWDEAQARAVDEEGFKRLASPTATLPPRSSDRPPLFAAGPRKGF